MKYALLFSTCVILSSAFSQISYDFAIPVPPKSKEVKVVNANYFGTYTSENSQFTYEFNETGIYVISINVNSISKETVRESTKYTVKNNFIFGVKENDSIPCVLENDNYYFGIKNRDKIAGYGSNNVLLELKMNQFVVNFHENGNYIPMFFSFDSAGLIIEQFDYDSNTLAFSNIKEQTSVTKDIEFVTLEPTNAEWKKLNIEEFKSSPLMYQR